MATRCAVSLFLLSCMLQAAAAESADTRPRTEHARRESAFYVRLPDIAACDPGVLKPDETAKVLGVVNDIRRLHGLDAVVYDRDSENQVMAAALMFAANRRLSHQPGEDWICHSKAGVEGASTSNIGGGMASRYLAVESSEEDVIGWHTDVNNTIADNVGHRRWLLDPFLKRVAYGRVVETLRDGSIATGSAIKVIYSDTWSNGGANADFVAYPVGDYPRKYYSGRAIFSFSAVMDLAEKRNNETVDFGSATVSVLKRGGERLEVTDLSWDNAGFGLPNNLQFRVAGVESGVHYDVRVSGVKVGGNVRDYVYWFRIVD